MPSRLQPDSQEGGARPGPFKGSTCTLNGSENQASCFGAYIELDAQVEASTFTCMAFILIAQQLRSAVFGQIERVANLHER